MNTSVWSDTVTPPSLKKLDRDLKCEALVIGGGMAGILIARELRERGIQAVVVEGQKIGGGITKNTTAVISAQHDMLYVELAKKHGAAKAKQYLKANLLAVKQFINSGIDCDLEVLPSVNYSMTDKNLMQREAEFVKSLGYNAEFISDSPLPFSIAGGVRFDGMAQFHPLKFLYEAAKKLEIYEDTYVTKVKGHTAYTKDFKIEAKHIVVAAHYPFMEPRGLFFLKMHQNRSYVLGLESKTKLDATYNSHDDDGLYFRNYGDLLLVGGVNRRVGKGICGYERVRKYTDMYYPGVKERYKFANQDCMTLDGAPYIGQYGRMKDIYVATGFNQWGMTSSMVSANILADRITGHKNECAGVFDSNRSILRAQLFANLGTVLVSLLKPTLPRCTHMGSSLKYNRQENCYECPCHGSRYTKDGQLIDNPAMHDTKV